MEKNKGYKVFNNDWTCRGFKYEVGKTYKMKEKPKMCEIGFHYCNKLIDCFNYYDFNSSNKVAEIEALGDIDTNGKDKCCTNKIKIIRELTWYEVLDLVNIGKANTGNCNSGNRNSGNCNSGDLNSGDLNSGDLNSGDLNSGNWNSGNRNSGNRNSGNRNSGNLNSGDWNSGDLNSGDLNSGNLNSGNRNSGNWNSGNLNSGDWNSGDWNSGNCNSGDWNSGDWNSGIFNTNQPYLRMFNQQSDWTYSVWLDSLARHILIDMPKNENVWVWLRNMSEQELKDNPKARITNGYLKTIKVTNEERQCWWDNLLDKDKKEVLSLPNFDADIFKEITGIEVQNGKE